MLDFLLSLMCLLTFSALLYSDVLIILYWITKYCNFSLFLLIPRLRILGDIEFILMQVEQEPV